MRGKANYFEDFPGAYDRAPYSIGQAIAWKPAAFVDLFSTPELVNVSGTVVYVNEAHRYYTAEAPWYGYAIRESFKF